MSKASKTKGFILEPRFNWQKSSKNDWGCALKCSLWGQNGGQILNPHEIVYNISFYPIWASLHDIPYYYINDFPFQRYNISSRNPLCISSLQYSCCFYWKSIKSGRIDSIIAYLTPLRGRAHLLARGTFRYLSWSSLNAVHKFHFGCCRYEHSCGKFSL